MSYSIHHTRYRKSRVVRLRGTDCEFEPGHSGQDWVKVVGKLKEELQGKELLGR